MSIRANVISDRGSPLKGEIAEEGISLIFPLLVVQLISVRQSLENPMERYKEQSNSGIQGYHSFLGGRRVRRLFLFIARKTIPKHSPSTFYHRKH